MQKIKNVTFNMDNDDEAKIVNSIESDPDFNFSLFVKEQLAKRYKIKYTPKRVGRPVTK